MKDNIASILNRQPDLQLIITTPINWFILNLEGSGLTCGSAYPCSLPIIVVKTTKNNNKAMK